MVVAQYFGAGDEKQVRANALINMILSVYVPMFGVFQGAGHSIFPMEVACGALGTRVLVTYLFRYSSFFGYTIIWWNGVFGFGMGFLITWIFYLSRLWMRGITPPDQNESEC